VARLEAEFSAEEELSHAITHGLGACASAVMTVLLVREAVAIGDALDVTAALLFGAAMTHQYVASTFCHALPDAWRTQNVFELMDFLGIYALIAATYTPFMLGPLRGPWGYALLTAVWAAALIGMALELSFRPRRRLVSISIYLGMGWMGLVAAFPLAQRLPPEGLSLLFSGGISYTIGVVFYLWRGFRYHHTVWHLFVLVGSALHAWAVARYAIPFSH
jgi:hemolysin III